MELGLWPVHVRSPCKSVAGHTEGGTNQTLKLRGTGKSPRGKSGDPGCKVTAPPLAPSHQDLGQAPAPSPAAAGEEEEEKESDRKSEVSQQQPKSSLRRGGLPILARLRPVRRDRHQCIQEVGGPVLLSQQGGPGL